MKVNEFNFYNSNKYKLTLCLITAGFFYLFMIFFLPFGVDNYNPLHKYTLTFLIEIFYFFVALFISYSINEFLLRPVFIKSITFKLVVIWSLWTFLFLSTVIFITYNLLGDWHDFNLKSYLAFILNCTSVLIFPVAGIFFYFRYQFLRKRIDHILTSKEETIDPSQLITFAGQGTKDCIRLSVTNFLFGKAQDNYVELYYQEQKSVKKFLLRASLKKLTESIANPAIQRSHRSYMVNLYHVNAVKGGQNELSLFLDPLDMPIPVSKTFKGAILKQLRILKNFT